MSSFHPLATLGHEEHLSLQMSTGTFFIRLWAIPIPRKHMGPEGQKRKNEAALWHRLFDLGAMCLTPEDLVLS